MPATPTSAMLRLIIHGDPPLLVCALFWTTSLTSLWGLIIDWRIYAILKSHWKLIATLLLLTLIWRTPPNGKFFHGLEYEDSYIYIVSARQMVEQVAPPSPSSDFRYSINACAVGSLNDCQEWESFPEHLVGYPYVLSVLYRLVGYTPDLASAFNIIAASFGGVLIFLVAMAATESVVIAGASSLVFAITPVFAVYGLETSAEPASNACIILVIWFYVRIILAARNSERTWYQTLLWIAFSTTLLFSMTMKRENALLGFILPVLLPFLIPRRTTVRVRRTTLMVLVLTIITLALLLCVRIGLLQSTGSEVELAKTFPLTPGHLAAFVVGFARSFIVPKWYMGAVLAVAAGIVIAARRRGLIVIFLVLFVGYFMAYAVHIRSYYEMRSGTVQPLAALRFSMNFMSLWSLLAGIGIGVGILQAKGTRIYGAHRRVSIIVGYCVVVAVCGTSLAFTSQLRSDAVEDEDRVRILPAESALSFTATSSDRPDYILTLEPLMIQMYGDTAANVIDLSAVNADQLRVAITSREDNGFIAVEEDDHETEADSIRYGDPLRYLYSLPAKNLYRADGFTISRIVRP